jgi:hypothetical protein
MTPNEIQNELNRLQAELDRLKQADTYFPESGEVVWVSDDLEEWHKRIFIKFLGFKSSPYKCVWENKSNTTKNYLLGKNYITSDWAYCRRMDGEIIPFGRDKSIQYHVAVHEAVTTEPNPYSVDWSNAPIWADVHCFDEDGRGFWYGSECLTKVWVVETCPSKFTLPTGLDWKLSKTIRPK